MSSWTVLDKTDNTLTIVLRRGEKKKSKKTSEDRTRSSSKKSTSKKRKHRRPRIDNDKLDENTEKALRSIREINKYLKHKYQIRSDPSSTSKDVSTSRSSTTTTQTQTPKSSSSEDVADKMYREVARIPKIAEAVDHKGYPLSHPLATTPFPGATTAAQREKARQMLRNLGRQQEESKKSSKKSSTKTDLCKRCHTCSECTRKCMAKHMVTEEERIKFRRGISQLRKDIQRPEKRRQTNNKSPYDQTQSGSETSISLSSK